MYIFIYLSFYLQAAMFVAGAAQENAIYDYDDDDQEEARHPAKQNALYDYDYNDHDDEARHLLGLSRSAAHGSIATMAAKEDALYYYDDDDDKEAAQHLLAGSAAHRLVATITAPARPCTLHGGHCPPSNGPSLLERHDQIPGGGAGRLLERPFQIPGGGAGRPIPEGGAGRPRAEVAYPPLLRFVLRGSLRNMSVGAAARLMLNGTGLSLVQVRNYLYQ